MPRVGRLDGEGDVVALLVQPGGQGVQLGEERRIWSALPVRRLFTSFPGITLSRFGMPPPRSTVATLASAFHRRGMTNCGPAESSPRHAGAAPTGWVEPPVRCMLGAPGCWTGRSWPSRCRQLDRRVDAQGEGGTSPSASIAHGTDEHVGDPHAAVDVERQPCPGSGRRWFDPWRCRAPC